MGGDTPTSAPLDTTPRYPNNRSSWPVSEARPRAGRDATRPAGPSISTDVRECPSRSARMDPRDKPGMTIGVLFGDSRGFAPGAGADLLALALQLAAGGEDVAAAGRADRRGVTAAVEDRGEGLDGPPVGTFVGAAGPGVERDQVDLGRDALEQLDQGLGLGGAVVDA